MLGPACIELASGRYVTKDAEFFNQEDIGEIRAKIEQVMRDEVDLP